MRKAGAFALAVAVVTAAACGGMAPPEEGSADSVPAANPIVGGTTDTGHPAVVLVLRTTGNYSYICTGTVIGPSVILTAGHCTQPDLDPTHYLILAGVTPFTHSDWKANATAIHPNPAYVGPSNTYLNDDGIIILDRIAPVTPMAWQQNNADAILTVGAGFTAVGFGVTTVATPPPGQPDDAGTKRTVDLQISQLAGTDQFLFGSAATNVCEGDSGGPAIMNVVGVDTVVGTVSYGDTSCSQYGADIRTDDNAAFIAQYANISVTPTPTPTPPPTPTPTPALAKKKSPLGCDLAIVAGGNPLGAALLALFALAGGRRLRR